MKKDGIAALEWLSKAFGFRERTRMTDKNGRLSQGEMEAGDGIIMLASPTPNYESRKNIVSIASRRVNGRRCRG